MQTTVQNTKSIRLGSVKWLVDWVDYWLLDSAVMEIAYKILSLKASNWKLPPKTKPESVKISCEMYEIHLPNVKTLDSNFDYALVAWSPVEVEVEPLKVATSTWATWEKLVLANRNGNKSLVTPLVIKNWSTTLTKDTDYYAYTERNWDVIIERIGSNLTVASWGLTATYTYTPATMHKLTLKDVMKVAEYRENKFINTDENWKELRIIMPKWYKSNWWNLSFANDEDVDQAMKPAIEITADVNEDNTLLIIEDEQSVE